MRILGSIGVSIIDVELPVTSVKLINCVELFGAACM